MPARSHPTDGSAGSEDDPGAAPRQGLLQIGQVAERTGLSLRTIRWYEEEGLIAPSSRTAGGFRLYSAEDVARLEVIKRMKPLGFALEEMRELLSVLAALDAGDGDRRVLMERLRMFHEAADAQVTQLRKQLELAQRFAEGLASHLGNPS